jgi:hypothetical protein
MKEEEGMTWGLLSWAVSDDEVKVKRYLISENKGAYSLDIHLMGRTGREMDGWERAGRMKTIPQTHEHEGFDVIWKSNNGEEWN